MVVVDTNLYIDRQTDRHADTSIHLRHVRWLLSFTCILFESQCQIVFTGKYNSDVHFDIVT